MILNGPFCENCRILTISCYVTTAIVARQTLEPLNQPGDAHGAQLKDGKVVLPPGSREAHEVLAEGGWIGLTENPDYGGQGVPHSVAEAV